MHILQIIHDRECGSVQKLAGIIEHGLRPHRVVVETVHLYPRAGLPIHQKLRYAQRLARRIRRGGFDALIAYRSTASILACIAAWLVGCRIRIVQQTCMPGATARLPRLTDKIVGTLGVYSANIVNSVAAWSEFSGYPARYRRAMILIEPGLDPPAPGRSRAETRRRFALPASPPILLNVGRLAEQKNQDLLIRALACLPQAHLVLAGTGPEKAALHELAVTLGVDERLHMLGALPADEIADLYAAADLFVFPSAAETFGLAAVEAATAGLPIVAADLPVLREMLRGDGTQPVAFVKSDDVEGWIAAIGRALAMPVARSAFAAALGRKYSRQRMIESYLSLFDGGRPRARTPLHGLTPAAEKART